MRQRDSKNGFDMQYVVNIKRRYADPQLDHSWSLKMSSYLRVMTSTSHRMNLSSNAE